MRRILLTVAGAALVAGSLAASTAADARPGLRGHGHYGRVAHRRSGRVAGAAIAAGIAGAVIGGAISAQDARHNGYYDRPYGYGYPAPAYGAYGREPY